MSVQLVTVIIDGREIQVPRGTLIVEAAKKLGVEIPVFCYHPKLKPVGACRMCLVDVQGMPRLQTACTTPVNEGMIILTHDDKTRAAQQAVIEMLLANHPLDCPICDKGGECPLQDNTFKYGLGTSRFMEGKRQLAKALPLSDRIVLDRERCIMCYRCVRFQDEIAGDQALSAIDRAGTSQIGVLEGDTFDSPFSGNTIDLCPVGALLSRQYRFRARPWDLVRTESVCAGCAVGCNIELNARGSRLQRMVPRENMAINNEWLCDRGRFDTLALGVERLSQPLVNAEPATWPAALEVATPLLRDGQAEVVVSPSLTNEALNAARSIASGLKASIAVWPKKTGRTRGSIGDLVRSKSIVLLDFDVWTGLPVLALRVREALAKGAKLYFVGSGANGLGRDTTQTVAGADALPELDEPISILGEGADELAERLEATGLVGNPPTAANGLSASDLREARFEAPALLLVGNEDWPAVQEKRVVSLRWSPGPGEVLLPIAHPYEQGGSITNLDGTVQELRAGAPAPGEAKADWQALVDLGRALGIAPRQMEERQAALA
ncbi:MAG: (2Fe-2S)-binding protein [Chloroflexi bacterium]|nr:(2Fe-2S)-binding protein [Chloroflexota bacterium]